VAVGYGLAASRRLSVPFAPVREGVGG